MRWTPTALLLPVASLQSEIDRTVESAMSILHTALGDARGHHVGSTALPEALTSGTVDILVLVDKSRLPQCRELVAGCAAQLSKLQRPVAVRISDRCKPCDRLLIRHLLVSEPILLGALLALQEQFKHRPGKAYPQAKNAFFESLLRREPPSEHDGLVFDQDYLLPHRIVVHGGRLRLCSPLSIDAAEYTAYLKENQSSHERFGDHKPEDLEKDTWQRRFAQESSSRLRREALTFLVRDLDSNRIIGSVHFFDFRWGRLRHCTLGYSLAQSCEGHGLMTEAVAAAVHYVSETWGIHRVQAFYDQNNTKSAKVLERVGFQVEGAMKSYLHVGSEWRDCNLAALHW